MSEAIYPTLPGMSITVRKTPQWSNNIKTSVSGKEFRTRNWSYPKWRFMLSYEVLRAGIEQELQTLVGFFNARSGGFESFLFDDQTDNTVSNQVIGTGNGVTKQFQLVRQMPGFIEPVRAPKLAPVIRVNNTVVSALTVDYSAGFITFNSAPASGTEITWTGQYYNRVRFARDEAELERFLFDLWSLRSIELVTDK